MTHKKGNSWVLKKNWEKLENMEEVIDALMNWSSLTIMTRWMSHEALSFIRVMVDLRWLSGLGRDEKEQVRNWGRVLVGVPLNCHLLSRVSLNVVLKCLRSHGWRKLPIVSCPLMLRGRGRGVLL